MLFGAMLLACLASAQTQSAHLQTPYGGKVVESIIARVNDRIITSSDYKRSLNELEQEADQRGETPEQIAEDRKNLLRNLIDQQLWLSKGKQLGISGDTGTIKRLDAIRKQYHLSSMQDLAKAAKQQGVSFADFKAHIRNQVIIQDVMRKEVGSTIQVSPLEARKYYEQHKQDYMQPESVHLGEILISTGKPGASGQENPKAVAAAKSKAENIEAKLHAGGSFSELARTFSDGPTAADGGDLGVYQSGQLPKLLEDKTFSLKAGQWTAPILTRQGWIILKVIKHTPAGPAPFDSVENKVEDALYMKKMEPAINAYLKKLRDQASIFIAPGYVDTGATENELHPSITFSSYKPPAPKKRVKVHRTRYRYTRSPRESQARKKAAEARKKLAEYKKQEAAVEKPGKKEKIRYGQKPLETLPPASTDASPGPVIENAGATGSPVGVDEQPENPYAAPTQPQHKWRYSDLAKERKHRHKKEKKQEKKKTDTFTAQPPTPGEVANREVQSSSLGMGGNATVKKKEKPTTKGEKVRYSSLRKKHQARKKQEKKQKQGTFTPAPPVSGAPAPANAPKQ